MVHLVVANIREIAIKIVFFVWYDQKDKSYFDDSHKMVLLVHELITFFN